MPQKSLAMPHKSLAMQRPLQSPALVVTLISSSFLLPINGILALGLEGVATSWKINSLLRTADTSHVQIHASEKF